VAALITMQDGQAGYAPLLADVIERGERRAPRGQSTLDARHVTMQLKTPWHSLPIGVGRNVSTEVAALEALQLIAGVSMPELLIAASPRFVDFTEDDGEFWGSYGPRVGPQLHWVVEKLKRDSQTRQAVMTIWDPKTDNAVGKKDYPCTVALGFDLASGQLNMHVVMRSSDVWLGIPYDWFQFTQLQFTVARMLNAFPGTYTHTSWSLHLYERNLEAARKVIESAPENPVRVQQPRGVGRFDDTPHEVQLRAGRILRGQEVGGITSDEEWYVEQVRRVRDRLESREAGDLGRDLGRGGAGDRAAE
jgi:thymidylate synthase